MLQESLAVFPDLTSTNPAGLQLTDQRGPGCLTIVTYLQPPSCGFRPKAVAAEPIGVRSLNCSSWLPGRAVVAQSDEHRFIAQMGESHRPQWEWGKVEHRGL